MRETKRESEVAANGSSPAALCSNVREMGVE